jgi:phosphoketolase
MFEENKTAAEEEIRREERVSLYRQRNSVADRWAAGYGPIQHSVETQARVFAMAELLAARGVRGDGVPIFEALYAADRVASAAMWIAVHETYAQNVYLDGRRLRPEDFKPKPEGHTGGVLNMIPAYTGYMAINAVTGQTRSWIMGQGHAVAAIDTLNLVLDNMLPAHAERYSLTDEGLTRYVRDYYSYRLGGDGKQDSPLGSHVNAYTAGGMAEAGYLGFVELQYVHIPLPGERLVVFLSDGAFEEQRGSDWAPRWWRADDCGLVTPIMINNGRRIDQRTTMSQQGGVDWFVEHLKVHGFNPMVFDGRDPAAFAWAIFEMESRLEAAAEAVRTRSQRYPVRLPYGIAVAPKGAGFYGEGTNLAHNLPLKANPHTDIEAAENFNQSARRLWVSPAELQEATGKFQFHERSGQLRKRDHPLAHRDVKLGKVPPLVSRPVPADRLDMTKWTRSSPMYAVDALFLAAVEANPHLRPRVGNPDEMRSNRLLHTLDALKFRVTDPEPGIPEDIHGAVITALNEEAVASAALANKGGINLIATYEAFGAKMQGVMRQEIIFANHCKELRAHKPGWLSIPLVLTSHTWENAKNEQSHQDPSMAESMLGEVSDVSRVVFVADYNTAAVVTRDLYQTHGQIWTLVVPKYDTIPDLFTLEEAGQLVKEGAMRLEWAGHSAGQPRLVLTAIGAYQLEEVLKASARLAEHDVAHSVVYMLEPGRFRAPRSDGEREHAAPASLKKQLYPDSAEARIFVTHTRPETMCGVLQPFNTGDRTVALGFIVQGGTLTTPGLLFVNRCTWAHIIEETARILGISRQELLTAEERAALDGKASPEGIIIQV